jgi:hypothetical protein
MASINLKSIPDEWHREIKKIQLLFEERGQKATLESIYIILIKRGMDDFLRDNPTK